MTHGTVLSAFTAAYPISPGRVFSGFPDVGTERVVRAAPREAHFLSLKYGDLLSFDGASAIIALSDDGHCALDSLGLTETAPVEWSLFDGAALDGWITARGGATGTLRWAALPAGEEPLILRASGDMSVWAIVPCSVADLVEGDSGRAITLRHSSDTGRLEMLAPPLGTIADEFTIKRGTASAYELKKGQTVQIIDVAGQQCSDFQATRLASVDRQKDFFIDATATRSITRRAFPMPGLFDKFFDAEMAPMLRLMQDTCGRHDTFGLACNARGYEERGFPGHVSCSDNISGALAPYGVARRPAWPAINFFWNTWLDHAHQLCTEESYSRAGDFVAMEAMDDLLCVSTACPDDIDPINGWNPTDIHVRIYEKETRIQRAIAYRPKEDAPMRTSEPSPFHDRLSVLTEQFAPARDLWAPVAFPGKGTLGEYWSCREAVTLQDLSSLRKLDVIGPDAERLLQMALTRDITRLPVWRGTYALMCDDAGEVVDDGTLFRLAPDLFRWCYGMEESARHLRRLAEDAGLHVRLHELGGSFPNLALQGPRSREVLQKIVFTQPHVPSVDQLRWFGVTTARLNDREGRPFMLSRTGYTGELGYELFCAKSDALEIWDALMDAGAEFGIEPMGSAALDILRIEAGFAAAGAEFAPGVDALEAGLGFAVDFRKAHFVGKAALERNKQAERKKLVGLDLQVDEVPAHGAPVWSAERQVGVITSATRSPMRGHAIAMARVGIEHAQEGQQLEVGQMDGRMKRLAATVCGVPFVDPKRERARA